MTISVEKPQDTQVKLCHYTKKRKENFQTNGKIR